MGRYAIKFTKDGYIKYISHLDLLRLFKRSFKKSEVELQYSQGYNPHPKMSFAQPLSLGYSGIAELIEIETKGEREPEKITEALNMVMPPGIEILGCEKLPEEGKTLAAQTYMAEYQITIPVENRSADDIKELCDQFLQQEEIIVMKSQKKTKKEAPINIRSMIKSIKSDVVDDNIIMTTLLDSGSNSNLSPELLLKAFLCFGKIPCERHLIEIQRNTIFFAS